eukprot:6173513-Pleurochrysis_carterae.AAC.3
MDELPLYKRYSNMKLMGVEDFRDQHKKHKALGKTGFVVSQRNRTAYVLQLQTLLLEADEDANNLDDGDSGIDGQSVRSHLIGRSRKRRRGLTSYMGYEWTEEEKDAFQVEGIVGKVVAGGRTAYANQG